MPTIYAGTDVSRFQGTINWATYAAVKSFVIIKCAGADDGLYTDSQFTINRGGARGQAGLRIGYYFFGDRNVDAATAANYFIHQLGALNNGEILVLDIENHGGGVAPNDPWAFTFCTAVYNVYGFYPFVYMSQFSPTSTSLSWPTTNPKAPLWVANYSLSSSDFSQTTGNADAAWGGLPAPNYQILQYSSSGVVAGISHVVDLDSFFSPNNTLVDWDNLGFQGSGPAPSPGTLTVATVAGPAITYTQPAKQTINLPAESYDQVLFSTTYRPPRITSSTWPVNIAGPVTGLTQRAFPIGNYSFSINGGPSNLNDFGFISAGGFGQFPGTLPTVVVQPIVASDGSLSFDVTVNLVNTGPISSSVDLVLNIALMAYPGTTEVPVSSVQQAVSRSSAIADVSPSPYSTYRRLASQGSAGTGASTIAHGQSSIPNVLYWVQDATGDLEPQPASWASTGHTSAFGVSMDATNLYFYVDSPANALTYFNIYKDN